MLKYREWFKLVTSRKTPPSYLVKSSQSQISRYKKPQTIRRSKARQRLVSSHGQLQYLKHKKPNVLHRPKPLFGNMISTRRSPLKRTKPNFLRDCQAQFGFFKSLAFPLGSFPIVDTREKESLKEFKLFRNLPVELRLKIFRMTWTSQAVNLTLSLEEVDTTLRVAQRGLHHLPVTLVLNRESRYETVRHYCWLADEVEFEECTCCNDDPEFSVRAGPIALNRSIDTCYIYFSVVMIAACHDADWHKNWIRALASKAASGLKQIKVLELREAWGNFENEGGYMTDYTIERFMPTLLLFSSLKTLYITSGPRWGVPGRFYRWRAKTYTTPARIKKCRDNVRSYLEKNKEHFAGGKIPNVVVRHKKNPSYIGVSEGYETETDVLTPRGRVLATIKGLGLRAYFTDLLY